MPQFQTTGWWPRCTSVYRGNQRTILVSYSQGLLHGRGSEFHLYSVGTVAHFNCLLRLVFPPLVCSFQGFRSRLPYSTSLSPYPPRPIRSISFSNGLRTTYRHANAQALKIYSLSNAMILSLPVNIPSRTSGSRSLLSHKPRLPVILIPMLYPVPAGYRARWSAPTASCFPSAVWQCTLYLFVHVGYVPHHWQEQ